MVWRDQETNTKSVNNHNSTADDDRNNHRNSDHNETENLLEPVTSPDLESVDGSIPLPVLATPEEVEPLIAENESSDQNISSNNHVRNSVTTPSSSPKNDFKTSPLPLRGVPVMVTLDPSDRASLNSGSTMFMRTSPLHPNPCRGTSEARITPEAMTPTASMTSVSTERPIIPLGGNTIGTRPSPIPMLPTGMGHAKSSHALGSHTHVVSSGGTATSVTTAASQEAIQLATVVENSPKSLTNSDQNNFEFYNICSPKALCGPHPRKVTIVVALILSIWASFVLGINIHKRKEHILVQIVEDTKEIKSLLTKGVVELQKNQISCQK